MEFDSVIDERKSVRSFKSKTPSWKLVIEAIDAARKAPFADGRNHLKFIIIEDQEKIDKIAELAAQSWISSSKLLVIVCSDDTNLENMHGDRGRIYSRQQSGAAIENFLLKLVDLGLSGCWVGSYSDEMIKQMLKIPMHIQIEAIIPVGYEAAKTKKSRKKEIEHNIFWESWDEKKRNSFMNKDVGEYTHIS